VARRFAEYLYLGEVPDDADGAPPPAPPPGDRVAPPDDDTLGALLGETAASLGAADADRDDEEDTHDTKAAPRPIAEEDRGTAFGTLRAPRHWERLLVDAAVIGGKDRWQKRLDGLHQKLEMDLRAYLAKAEDGLADGVRRDLAALDTLRKFALPIVGELAALPTSAKATWGDWLEALAKLATRAIRRPERVLAVLGELHPMARVGPVDITEVRLVLERRLSQLVMRPSGRRYGKVYVATIEEARGLAFDVVFIPGLAEKMFPQKVVEDPLLLDEARLALNADLPTEKDRTAEERLALRIAVGAAGRRVVLSYPRVDVEQARPRTPSFYGLEVLRVAEGELRDFHYLAETAAKKVDARIGWPAPANRKDAIDEAEYDLALLESVLQKTGKDEDACVGEAHYLLSSNDHLARALRFRGRRWLKTWKAADGLVDPPDEALAAIREHNLDKRSFSPTALQNFAACPYRFLLSAVHRLAKREEPSAIEDLDPLTRGSLVHEVQFRLLTRLRDSTPTLLPVTKPRLDQARDILDEVLAEVAAEEHERLNPAIERVWKDAMEGIAADLREWLRRMQDEPDWTPAYFELSFGLKDRREQDAVSKDDPVTLNEGIQLRGSIDLVERDDSGRLRATDYKTGKVRAKRGDIIASGEILQPVLYALTIEKLFSAAPATVPASVKEGRLYYCTAAGDFTKVDIPLSEDARDAAKVVATTIGESIKTGFLPAAPAKDACRYCDFRPVCGPYEEIRTKRKAKDRLKGLIELRRQK
jgi:CRISPR/Cas system-associated exonuclease Cas4 (RecB family)